MEYNVPCDCGQSLTVRAGDAGASKLCVCGRELQVPPLSVLRRTPSLSNVTEKQASSGIGASALFVVTVIIAIIAGLQSPSLLLPIGALTFLVGRVWFAMQIVGEMAPANALIVLFVPFMPTFFFFQRFDITWKPFLYSLMGVAIGFFGLPAP